MIDGQAFVYHASAPSTPDTPLNPIGGLEDGETYRVIVKDENTIQLAKSASIDLDVSGMNSDVLNTLRRRAVSTVSGTQVDLVNNILTLPAHGYSERQVVTAANTQDWTLDGVLSQADYEIHVIDANRFQLLTVNRSEAGANPQTLAGTEFFIVDLTLQSAAQGQPATVAKGSLFLGFSEAPITFPAASSVKAGGTIELPSHGLQTGDLVSYDVVQSTPTQVAVNRAALFRLEPFDFTFNPNETATTVSDNTILLPNGHSLQTGQRVTYTSGGGQSIGGLVSGNNYYVIVAGPFGIQLAATQSRALQGLSIALSSSGSGTQHHLLGNPVDTLNNQLVIQDHQLQTGQKIVYQSAGGQPIGGLIDGAAYYVIRVSPSILSLALSRQNASAGQAIDLGTGATGVQHGLVSDNFVSVVDASRTTPLIDYVANTIEILNHGLVHGSIVAYDPGENDAIGGLPAGNYSVIVVDSNHIRLATTNSPNQPIDLLATNMNSGLQEITQGDKSFVFDPLQTATVDVSADTIWLRQHRFKAGERITYLTGGGNAIGGLVDGHDYIVLAGSDDNNFKLADASNSSVPINLTSSGSGASQGFERASNADRGNSPIRGLSDGGYYYVTRLDANHIRLSDTEEGAFAAEPIDLSLTSAQQTNSSLKHSFTVESDEDAGVNVLASSTAENRMITRSQVGGAPVLSNMLMGEVTPTNIKEIYKGTVGTNSKVTSPTPVSITGAIGISNYVHNVDAIVGSQATLASSSNVNVNASSENFSQVIADGKATVSKDVTAKKVAVGTATALGFYENNVHATVEPGATIDADHDISVDAKITYPDLTKFLPFNPARYDIKSPDNGDWMTELAIALNGRGGVDNLFGLWANSTSTAEETPSSVSVTGSAASGRYRNVVEATIAANAKINQNRHDDQQSVNVTATSEMELLNLAGGLKLELDPTQAQAIVKSRKSPISPVGNEAGKVGVGGSILLQNIESRTVAKIDADAKVNAGNQGGVHVKSNENVLSVNLAQSGGKSGTFGLSGSVSVAEHHSTTLAQIGDGVQIHGGPIEVQALDNTNPLQYRWSRSLWSLRESVPVRPSTLPARAIPMLLWSEP
ncbi:MAG: hypothetical protein U0930_04385 [Pirellulales bacterium]